MNIFQKYSNNKTLREFVRLPLSFFSLVGIKLFMWDDNDIMTNKEKFIMIFTMTNLVLNFLFKCGFSIFGEFEDTSHLTAWSLYLSFATNGFFKMFSVAFGRKTLNKVLKDLEPLFPRTPKERREFRLAEGNAYIMRHAMILSVTHWVIALMFIIFPIVQSTMEYILRKDDDFVFQKRFPYIMVYPFDTASVLGYALAYSSQFLGGFTISCYFVGSDMLLLYIIYVVNLQFNYLCYRIRNFKSEDYETDMLELSDIMEKHHILNDLANRVNNIFSLSILLNYMISIMVVVLIGIQIITGSEFLDLVKFIGFFISATIQMYYVCMFGTQLIEYSAEVSEAFFGQEWYMADVRYQRMITLGIMRSQRPAHLTAFKFFKISMESYSNFMTTAYQFFTLLKARMEEGQL